MATFSIHTQERVSNIETLNQIIEMSVNKIEAIDNALEELVRGGLKGAAVETMATTYKKNRDNISDLLKLFAKYSVELQTQQERAEKLDSQANENAKGTPIQ